jgi:hypothetical protein
VFTPQVERRGKQSPKGTKFTSRGKLPPWGPANVVKNWPQLTVASLGRERTFVTVQPVAKISIANAQKMWHTRRSKKFAYTPEFELMKTFHKLGSHSFQLFSSV